MVTVRRGAARVGLVDDAMANRINRVVNRTKRADGRALVVHKAADHSMGVLRSPAAGRRAKAAGHPGHRGIRLRVTGRGSAASPARIVAAVMVVRRRENRGRKVRVRAVPMSSSPSLSR